MTEDDSESEPLPEVMLGADEHRVTEQVLKVLPKVPNMFQRAGQLVEVSADSSDTVPGLIRESAGPRIRILPQSAIREYITKYCALTKLDRHGEVVDAHPPEWLVKSVAQRGVWAKGVRHLEAIVPSPMFVKGGRFLEKAGYDEETGLYVSFPRGVKFYPVPKQPTASQIRAAVSVLDDWLVDFLFERPEHKAACLAAVFTYFTRFALKGGVPLFLIDSNVRAAGKGKLIDAIAMLCLGRDMNVTTQPIDHDEQKQILRMAAMSGSLMTKIDNIDRPFGNGVFDSALTSNSIDERPLYTDNLVPFPLYTIWLANGNNVQFKTGCDTASRTVHARLNVPMERPEDRGDFVHKDILEFTRKKRPELVNAVLTLIRGYVQAGIPDKGLKPWSRFPAWSRLIRHCLVWAGYPDPHSANAQLVNDADNTNASLGDLLEGWAALCARHKTDGFSVREALTELEGHMEEKSRNGFFSLPDERLLNALLELAPTKNGRLADARVVGCVFRKYKNTVVRGLRLEMTGEKTEAGHLWAARPVTPKE